MQKLQRNFVESKMNKDLDNRFVPAGEYRDALNISVITNTDSSSGAVQNSKGNKAISDLSRNIETKGQVNGSVSNSRTVTFDNANEELQIGMYLYSEGVFPNLFTNPSFDTDVSDWIFYGEGGIAHGFTHGTVDGDGVAGGYCYRSTAPASGSNNAYIRQDISVVSGTTYIMSLRKQWEAGNGKVAWHMDIENDGSYSTVASITETSGDWVTKNVEFKPTFTGTLQVRIYMHGDGTGWIDDCIVKKKDTQPIIIDISADKKTITLNTPVTIPDNEIVYAQYSKMLPNECVGSIEEEGDGAIYWMTSSRDDDNSRQFNFRNAEQRSTINMQANPNFQENKVGGTLGMAGWYYHEDHITVTNPNTGDNFITIGHKAGSDSRYPQFYGHGIKFEHGKKYKLTYNITGVTGSCKMFLLGVMDKETKIEGNCNFRVSF